MTLREALNVAIEGVRYFGGTKGDLSHYKECHEAAAVLSKFREVGLPEIKKVQEGMTSHSLTDLEGIVEELCEQRLDSGFHGPATTMLGYGNRELAARIRAWIAREREFIEASEEYCAKNPVWGYPRLMVAYRAREERKKGET